MAVGAILGVLIWQNAVVAWAAAAFVLLLVLIRHRFEALLLLFAAAATFGLSLWHEPARPAAEWFDGSERTFCGEVLSVRRSDLSQRLIVAVDSPASMRCRVMIPNVAPTIECSELIRMRGVPVHPHKYSFEPTLFVAGSDSYETVADLTVFPADIEVTGKADGWRSYPADIRQKLSNAIYSSSLEATTARLLAAAMLGGGDVGSTLRNAFRSAGLSHLLCVSGFHVGLLAVLVGLLFFPLRLWQRAGRAWVLAVIGCVWLYALVVGAEASVVRAAVMITVFCLGALFQRSNPPFNSLCVAVAVILFINPFWLFSVGFQMSVAAVAGLIFLADSLNPISYRHKSQRAAWALVAVPAAAWLATAPVLLWHFHSLPLLAIPLNALASLLFPAFIFTGLGIVALEATGLSLPWLATIPDTLAKAIDSLGATAAEGSVARGIFLNAPSMILLVGALILLGLALHSHKRKFKAVFFTASVVAAICPFFIKPERRVNDILVHANAFGCEMRIRNGSRGYIVPLSGSRRPIGVVDDYFLDAAIEPDSILLTAGAFCEDEIDFSGALLKFGDIGLLSIGRNSFSDSIPPHLNAVVVQKSFRGKLSDILENSSVDAVLLAPGIKPEVREDACIFALDREIPAIDLLQNTFRLSSCIPLQK